MPRKSEKAPPIGERVHNMIFGDSGVSALEDSADEPLKPWNSRLKDLTNLDINLRKNTAIIELREILEYHGENITDLVDREAKDSIERGKQGETEIEGERISIRTPLKRFSSILQLSEEARVDEISANLVCCIQGLPAYVMKHHSMIENLISYIIFHLVKNVTVKTKTDKEEEELALDLGYTWGIIENESYVHAKQVFVKFNDVLNLYLFQVLLNGVITNKLEDSLGIHVFVSTAIKEKVIPEIENKFQFYVGEDNKAVSDLRENVIKHIAEIEYIVLEHENETDIVMGDDDDDEYTKMYNEYKIDPKDISHISADVMETVKKFIIDFRLHALKVQKEKKEKRLLNEKERADTKLRALLKPEEDDPMTGINEVNEDGNDWEAEVKRVKTSQFEEDRKFEADFIEFKKKEEARLRKHERYLKVIKHDVYVNDYIPGARKQFMKKFIDSIDSRNSIDKNFNYYTIHGNYVKFRQQKKQDEEAKDDEDRKLEEEKKQVKEGVTVSDEASLDKATEDVVETDH